MQFADVSSVKLLLIAQERGKRCDGQLAAVVKHHLGGTQLPEWKGGKSAWTSEQKVHQAAVTTTNWLKFARQLNSQAAEATERAGRMNRILFADCQSCCVSMEAGR